MLRGLVLAALLGGPLEVGVEPRSELDAEALHHGIELRLGSRAEGWRIHIETIDLDHVRARLVSPDGEVRVRTLTLTGQTPEDRSRELAATLALLMEDAGTDEPPETTRAPTPDPTPPPTRGWIALTGHVGFGRDLAVTGGAGLRGGAWLLREHLQPLAEIDWMHAGRGRLTIDGVRFGAGLAGGTALATGRVWLGAGALARAVWAAARAEGRGAAWTSSTFVGPIAQVRIRRLVIGARVGVDLTLPPLRFEGNRDVLRWGLVRMAAGLSVGSVLPWRTR